MDNVNLKRKVTLKRKSDTPDQAPEGKKPNKLIWLAVLGLVIIGGIFGLNQLNQNNAKEGVPEDAVVSEDVNTNLVNTDPEIVSSNNEDINSTADKSTSEQSDDSNNDTEKKSTTSVENAVVSKPNRTGEANATKDVDSKDTPSNKGNQSSAVSVQGSIEEKAKQAIRGNFGNGKDRKLALGPEYELIQARVNEMYRNGIN